MFGIARAPIVTAVAALLLAWPSGCANEIGTLCADAASHVLACSGSSASTMVTKCATTAAEAVLKEDCEDVAASVDGGKSDGAWSDVEGYLCVHLEMPEFCTEG